MKEVKDGQDKMRRHLIPRCGLCHPMTTSDSFEVNGQKHSHFTRIPAKMRTYTEKERLRLPIDFTYRRTINPFDPSAIKLKIEQLANHTLKQQIIWGQCLYHLRLRVNFQFML